MPHFKNGRMPGCKKGKFATQAEDINAIREKVFNAIKINTIALLLVDAAVLGKTT